VPIEISRVGKRRFCYINKRELREMREEIYLNIFQNISK
jgi:hypothetical protein